MQKEFSRKKARSNLKKFSNKNIDYAQYVSDFYLENGLAFISSKPQNFHSIISSYSVNGYEWLNEDFAKYIESNAYYIPTEYPIVLEICGVYSQKEKEVIDETIHDYYSLKLGDKQIDLLNNIKTIKSTIIISIIGLLFMFIVKKFSSDWSLYETVSTFYCIFVWRIADLVFERIELKQQKTDAAQLASIKIKFSERFIDGNINDEIVRKVNLDVFGEE